MPAGILIIRTESGSHARELIDGIFGVDSFVLGDKLLTIYGDDPDNWFEPLAYTMTEVDFLRRFLGGGDSQHERETMGTTMMEGAKKLIHSAGVALRLVDSDEEIALAKKREAAREQFSKLDERATAMKAAAHALDDAKQKIALGEMFDGAERPLEKVYLETVIFFRASQQARTVLFDSAPDALRTKYFRKKRELVSVQTRINLLNRQQIPDCERAIANMKAGAEAAASFLETTVVSETGKRQLAKEARDTARDIQDAQSELDFFQQELATLSADKLPALQSELNQINSELLAY